MKKIRLASFAALYCAFTIVGADIAAQTSITNVAMKAESWEFQPQKVEFLEYKSKPAMKILPGAGPVVLKSLDFTDGAIEFDFEPIDTRFVTVYFRWQNASENECFYFRMALAGNPTAGDAVQYAPYLGGINLWDMLGHFQGAASFQKQAWNHVKLVVSGAQMRA